MWSKTRQILKSRLADSLKGRVDYHYDVYRTIINKEKPDWHMEMHVFSIIVDGEAWLCTNPEAYALKSRKGFSNKNAEDEVVRETGLIGGGWWWTEATKYIHPYLNELSINEALTHDNYFIRLLAVLDSRIGKRRLRPLLDNIDNEPEWFRKWIRLRCEAEGLCGKVENVSVEQIEESKIENQ